MRGIQQPLKTSIVKTTKLCLKCDITAETGVIRIHKRGGIEKLDRNVNDGEAKCYSTVYQCRV